MPPRSSPQNAVAALHAEQGVTRRIAFGRGRRWRLRILYPFVDGEKRSGSFNVCTNHVGTSGEEPVNEPQGGDHYERPDNAHDAANPEVAST